MQRRQKLSTQALIAGLAFVFYNTLIPFRVYWEPAKILRNIGRIEWVPFMHHGSFVGLTDIMGNILLFIPVGMLLLAWLYFNKSHKNLLLKAVLYGIITSLCIEFLQLFFKYRITSVHDIITNTIGAFLGAVSALVLIKRYFNIAVSLLNTWLLNKQWQLIAGLFIGSICLEAIMPMDFIRQTQHLPWLIQTFKWNLFHSFSIAEWLIVFLRFAVLAFVLRLSWNEEKKYGVAYLFWMVVLASMIFQLFHAFQKTRISDLQLIFISVSGFFVAWYLISNIKNAHKPKSFVIILSLYALAVRLLPFSLNLAGFEEMTVKNFIPFYHYYKVTSIWNLYDILEAFLFGYLFFWGLLMAEIKHLNNAKWKKVIIAAIFFILLELSQIWNHLHLFDITDLIFTSLGILIAFNLNAYRAFLIKQHLHAKSYN